MMTVVPTVSPVVSTLRRPVACSLVAGILVFALPLLVSCRLDQLLQPGKFAGLRIQPDTVGVADTVRLRVNMTAPLRFTASPDSLATVDQNGVVTGLKRGKVAITATVTGVPGVDRPSSTTDTVWVVAVSVSLTRQLDTLTSVDDTTCLKAAAFDKRGDTLTAAQPTITKTSDPDNTLTAFGGPGCYRATKSGRTATFEALLDTARAQVTLRQDAYTATIAPSPDTIRTVSGTETATATAKDSLGHPIPDSLVVFDWVSDSTTIVTARTLATGRGELQAQQEGRARIRVSAASGDRVAADTDSVTVQFK